MKNILSFLVLVLIVSSCTTVSFVKPMPLAGEELSEFPAEFLGEFLDANTKDTIKVTKQSFSLGNDMDFTIGDKAKLKTYEDYYILSLKSDKENENNWGVFPFKIENGNIVVYFIVMENDDKTEASSKKFKDQKVKDLNSVTLVKTTFDRKNNIDNYIINPTDDEFKKLFEIGLFQKTYKFEPVK